MRCLARNKRPVYFCKEYQDGNISKFTKPIKIYINYQGTNSESDLIALGKEFPIYMRVKADLEMASMFKTGDRMYIYKTPSNPFDVLCKDADYEINSDPIISMNSIEFTLERLSGK